MARGGLLKLEKSYGNYTGRRFARVLFPDGRRIEIITRGPRDGSSPNAWGDSYPFDETRRSQIFAKAAELARVTGCQCTEEYGNRDCPLHGGAARKNPRRVARKNPPEYKTIGAVHVVPGEGGWWVVQDATTHGGGSGEIVVAGPFAHESQARSAKVQPFTVVAGKLVQAMDGSRRRAFPAVPRPRHNPPLVVLGNPGKSKGSHILSKNIHSIRYQHEADGGFYEHKFKRGSYIELLPDGSIRVFNPRGVKLWGDY